MSFHDINIVRAWMAPALGHDAVDLYIVGYTPNRESYLLIAEGWVQYGEAQTIEPTLRIPTTRVGRLVQKALESPARVTESTEWSAER